ncbi:MAG: SDR family oxidoreductase [Alphaproteobacteria bacterium]|nr:SDR family oxidoreductase [Alphaproteobacteria bacterium]
MDMNLTGKRVLVTGTNGGIGKSIAAAFLREGGRVAVHARKSQTAAEVASELGQRAIPVYADLSDTAAIRAMAASAIDALGGLDVLINNAGIFETAPIGETTEDMWDRSFAINTKSTFVLSQACIPAMTAQGTGGAILFISSTSDKDAAATYSAYNASKHAVRGLMRCLAVEMAPHKIRVNCIAPGWVETPMAGRARQQYEREGQGDVDQATAEMKAHSLLGEIVPPDAIADMAVYLASDRGAMITAQSVSVCGGTTHWG